MKTERFEDIRAWQTARELVNLVYDATGESVFSKDFGLRNQIQSAAGSIRHNIAEGFESGSDPEFVRFHTCFKSLLLPLHFVSQQLTLFIQIEYYSVCNFLISNNIRVCRYYALQ